MSEAKDKVNSKGKSDDNKKYPRVVVRAFVFNNQGELFLMKQPKWHNLFTSPGGGVRFGESLEEALKREVKEETNMAILDIEFLCVMNHPDLPGEREGQNNHAVALYYTARATGGNDIELSAEGTEYKWQKPEDWVSDEGAEISLKEICRKYFLDHESWEHKYKRAIADYQNLLKRTAKEKEEFAKFANEELIRQILPVYDNLKISLLHANGEAAQNGWLEGVKHVVRQFKDTLLAMGVEEIETVGKKFDHHSMEAIEGKGEKVKREVRPGYKLHGKVIVPAKVIVED